MPAWSPAASFWADVCSLERQTRRFIAGLDVPFVEGGPVEVGSVPWLMAGLLPALLALIVLPLPLLAIAIISIVPAGVRAFELLEARAHNGVTNSSAFVPIYFLIILLPVAAPLALILAALLAYFDAARVAPLVMMNKRSWAAGFSVVPGALYACVRARARA